MEPLSDRLLIKPFEEEPVSAGWGMQMHACVQAMHLEQHTADFGVTAMACVHEYP